MKRTLFLILASGLILAACSDEKSLVLPEDEPIGNVTPVTPVTDENSCQANETACDGYTLLECGKDGKFVATPCSKGEICVEVEGAHSCMTPERYEEITHPAVTKECDPDQSKCEIGKRYTCDEDGNWAVAEDCIEKGGDCEMEDGTAVCKTNTIVPPEPQKECEDGESKCDANIVLVCNEDGQFVESQNCASTEDAPTCEIQEGAAVCVASCTEGNTRCNGGTRETCTDGSYTETPCDPEYICKTVDGNATCVELPPEPVCADDEVKCTEDGLLSQCVDGQWVSQNCPDNHECKDVAGNAACVESDCHLGDTRCGERNMLLTCDDAGTWIETSCIKAKKICSPEGEAGKAACIAIGSGEGGDVAEIMDTDGDTIPDKTEGRETNRDTDKDGIPDYLDLDSDNDTIPDVVEAWSGEPPTSSSTYYTRDKSLPPDDSDYDGVPNYIDEDSDDNGILDKDEACPGKVAACKIESMAAGKDAEGKDLSNKFDAVMMPLDTDKDKTADYLDYDNDGDTFSDIEEIRGLVSTSNPPAKGNYSGNCNKSSKQGTAAAPLNCKSGTPADYMNTDSDGDGLSDKFEGLMMKGDHFARYITDSDEDGLNDYEECFPTCKSPEVCKTPDDGVCQDSDGDGVPDMLETDSDGDGIPDKIEKQLGSSSRLTDSDGDGAPDIVEYAICLEEAGTSTITSCPAMSNSALNPQADGNFVFTTPYKKKSDDPQALSLQTSIQTIDLFFTFDSSASMPEEVESLKDSLPTMIANLKCAEYGPETETCEENRDCKKYGKSICSERHKCIKDPSEGEGCFDNMWTGLGWYGNADSFWVASHLTNDTTPIISSLQMYMDDFNKNKGTWVFEFVNSDGTAEAPYQAPICAVLGNTDKASDSKKSTTLCHYLGKRNCSTTAGRVGCVGYRKEAIRIDLQAFDEDDCTVGTSNVTQQRCQLYRDKVGETLKSQKVRFIGLWGVNGSNHMDQVSNKICIDSGSVNSSSQPFSYKAMDSDLAAKAAQGIREIAKGMPMEITSSVEDLDNDENKNAKKLIAELNVHKKGGDKAQGRTCTAITETVVDLPKDGNTKLQGIESMYPGKVLCYDVVPVDNQDIFPAKTTVQVKKARVKVMGDGSVLNSGIAYFVIPPELEGSNE